MATSNISPQRKTLSVFDVMQWMKHNRFGPEGESTWADVALHDLNNALFDLSNLFDWSFYTRLEPLFQVIKARTDGTITVTLDSKAVTGVGTSFAAADIGGQIIVNGDLNQFEVAAVASTTALTLSDNYIGDNAGSGKSYTIFFDRYSLPSDIARLTKVLDRRNFVFLHEVIFSEIRELFNISFQTGDPRQFAIEFDQIFFFPSPSTTKTFEIIYQRKPIITITDNEFIDWPEELANVLYSRLRLKYAEESGKSGKIVTAQSIFDRELKNAKAAANRSGVPVRRKMPHGDIDQVISPPKVPVTTITI